MVIIEDQTHVWALLLESMSAVCAQFNERTIPRVAVGSLGQSRVSEAFSARSVRVLESLLQLLLYQINE
jgi:hypothetical protein